MAPVDVQLIEACEDREGVVEGRRVVDEVHSLAIILFTSYPEDSALVGGSAGEGVTGGDGQCNAGGEAGLAALGVPGQDGEAALADEVFDDEAVFFVFDGEGEKEVRRLIRLHLGHDVVEHASTHAQ